MDFPLKPGFWYRAQVDIRPMVDIHEHFRDVYETRGGCVGGPGEYSNYARPALAGIGELPMLPENLKTMPIVCHHPTYSYQVQANICAALKSLLKLSSLDEDGLRVATDNYAYIETDKAIRYEVNADELTKIRGFVERFGPLVHDFSEFCRPLRYYPLMNHIPADLEKGYGTRLMQVGWEHFYFLDWRDYIQGLHRTSLTAGNVSPLLSPPAIFYLWAADMLAALKQFPDWPGCRLFLANRMSSFRQLPASAWGQQGIYLTGELFDYLAFHIRYGLKAVETTENIPCLDCGNLFSNQDDRRYGTCPDCRNSIEKAPHAKKLEAQKLHAKNLNAKRQERYRERHAGKA